MQLKCPPEVEKEKRAFENYKRKQEKDKLGSFFFAPYGHTLINSHVVEYF